jgi:hypothetical protein
MHNLTAWLIRGKGYVCFGHRCPGCLHDWREYLKDETLKPNEVVFIQTWAQTLDILRNDFRIIDPEKLAYPDLEAAA